MQGFARALAGIVIAGCSAAAPSGFSQGEHWTFPLVGPLENGLLITPVTIHGHGPYLFAIDPDANVTAVDDEIAEEAGLTLVPGAMRIDEAGVAQPRAYAQLLDLQIGTLTIESSLVMLAPGGFYDAGGRRVHGVLGRDALPGTLVFGFDRDHGIATLSTTRSFTPPPDAIAIPYRPATVTMASEAAVNRRSIATAGIREATSPIAVSSRSHEAQQNVIPLPRRLATAHIGGAALAMHLDLGAPFSGLRETRWDAARLVPAPAALRVVDEVAYARWVSLAATANAVTVGAATSSGVTLVPYVDKRFSSDQLDGTLGLDFFAPYAVYAHWNAGAFYLKPRGDAAATRTARLGRWPVLAACANPGCVTAQITTAEDGLRIEIVRDPQLAGRPLEVFLGVALADGTPTGPLLAELPTSVDRIAGPIPERYAGATLTVLDASPFPRTCSRGGGCVIPLGKTDPSHVPDANDASGPSGASAP